MFGYAFGRPLQGGGDQRLLHCVFARVKVGVPAGDRAEHLRREFTQQVLDASGRVHAAIGYTCGGPAMTWRTSMGMFSGRPPRPGAAEARAASSAARCGPSQSTIQ